MAALKKGSHYKYYKCISLDGKMCLTLWLLTSQQVPAVVGSLPLCGSETVASLRQT